MKLGECHLGDVVTITGKIERIEGGRVRLEIEGIGESGTWDIVGSAEVTRVVRTQRVEIYPVNGKVLA